MYTSKNPAKSRPLSANVKRLMQLARASPQDRNVVKVGRQFSIRDLAYCNKQGSLFMEAASMGFAMRDFAPLYMTSQIAGIFDVYFSTSNGVGSNELFDLIRIPMLLKSPETVVEALYWIDDIIERAEDGENKSLLISRAYEAETLKLPPALAGLPEEPNRTSSPTPTGSAISTAVNASCTRSRAAWYTAPFPRRSCGRRTGVFSTAPWDSATWWTARSKSARSLTGSLLKSSGRRKRNDSVRDRKKRSSGRRKGRLRPAPRDNLAIQ